MERPRDHSILPACRRAVVALAAASIPLLLYACAGEDRFSERICPRVQVLEYADRLTEFAHGAGRDLTDVVLKGRLVDFDGECNVEDDKVEMDLTVEFVLERGPANRSREGRFAYFVAIPEFHPAERGKRVFPVQVKFESGVNRVLYRDEIAVEIPVTGRRRAPDFNVFMGFQLDRDQLRFNRSGS